MVWTLGCSSPTLPLASAGSEFGISQVTDAGDMGSFPGSRRFPGGGNDNVLQYSSVPWTEESGGLQMEASSVFIAAPH